MAKKTRDSGPATEDRTRRAVLDAGGQLLEDRGVARTRLRDVAHAAGLSTRAVTSVVGDRSDLLGQVVAGLPFPPTPRRLREQAEDPHGPAVAALLAAARDAFGQPASAWDSRELQAMAVAPYDDALAEVVRDRLRLRWEVLRQVLRQLRGSGGVDEVVDDDAAVLHAIALGVGLAMLAPLAPRWAGPTAWASLAARLIESLAALDPPAVGDDTPTRMWRIRAAVPDTPAAVARLLRVLALLHARVLALLGHGTQGEERVVDVMVAVPADVERGVLEQALASVSSDVIVVPGVAEDSQDLTVRVLDVAAELATNPGAAPATVALLVQADSWQVIPAAVGEDASAHVMRVQWTPDRHVVLRRGRAPFTRTERARVSALLRLVEALAEARGDDEDFGWVEPVRGGRPVWIRLARPEDSDAVAAMHERCSEQTRYQRYFAPISEWREENLRRISGGHRGVTLVVVNQDGDVIGLGNVFPDRPGDVTTAEVALIVEDAYQGRGVGGRLLEHLLDLARRLGFARVVAFVLAENTGMLRLLHRTALDWEQGPDPELGAGVVRAAAALTPDRGDGPADRHDGPVPGAG